MKTKERLVHFYDLILSSYTGPNGIANPSCCSLDDFLSAARPKGFEMSQRSLITEVSDWKHDKANGAYYMLLNRADKNVSDVGFRDFTTKARRKALKKTTEGIEQSCHVIIKPTPGQPRGLVLMTMGSGTTYDAIEKVFREIAKDMKKVAKNSTLFEFPAPSGALDANGKPVTYKVNYKFQFVGHKSALLDNVLKSGRFLSMELLGHEQRAFDASGNLQIKRQSIFIEAANASTVTGAVVKNSVRRFMKLPNTQPVDHARVSYQGQDGVARSTTFPANDLDAAFTRREHVSLGQEVDAQQDVLDVNIISAMRALI